MADEQSSADSRELNRLPPDPQIAMMLACLYQRLGGDFSISSNGRRGYYKPLPNGFDEIPQLSGMAPDELFRDEKEWAGAMKVIRALLKRLDDQDADFVFGLFAG